MGGFGSTRWRWVSTKDTVESSRSLDINRLNRAGCLHPGYRGGWEWTRDAERVASIWFRRDGDRLILSLPGPAERRRMAGCRAVDADCMDTVPVQWRSAVFSLPGYRQWDRLRAPDRQALRRHIINIQYLSDCLSHFPSNALRTAQR